MEEIEDVPHNKSCTF